MGPTFLEKLIVVCILVAVVWAMGAMPVGPHYGFAPWPGAPRFEFSSEPACWEWLARAKATNDSLKQTVCSPDGPARSSWSRWRAAFDHP